MVFELLVELNAVREVTLNDQTHRFASTLGEFETLHWGRQLVSLVLGVSVYHGEITMV
jgi:hypothetical protein